MMRAVTIDGPGQAPRLTNLDPLRELGAGQLLLSMRFAPINPADRLTIAGNYSQQLSYPMVAGAEGVGRVVAVGAGVDDVATGDHVLPLTRGNWATHRTIDRADVVILPRALTLEQAAMLRINPATAWRLLDLVSLKPGQWVIQNGASSQVARWVRAIAVMRGINVLNIVRGPALHPGDVSDGADLRDRAAEMIGKELVPPALDCLAGAATGQLAELLSPGGTIAIFGHLSGQPCVIRSELLTGRRLHMLGFSLRPAEAGDDNQQLQALYSALAGIEMSIPVAATYALDDFAEALAHAARPGLGGRILLAFDR